MAAWEDVDIIWLQIVCNGLEEFDIVEHPLKMNEFSHKNDTSKLDTHCPNFSKIFNYYFRKKEMKKLERLQQKERNGNEMSNDFMGFIYDDELGADEIQGS